MADAAINLQNAIFAILEGNEADLGVTRVYASMPDASATSPHITLGEIDGSDNSTKTEDGEELNFRLHIWSNKAHFNEVNTTLGKLREHLHGQTVTVEGFKVVFCRMTGRTAMHEPDGKSSHGIADFRVLMQRNAS